MSRDVSAGDPFDLARFVDDLRIAAATLQSASA